MNHGDYDAIRYHRYDWANGNYRHGPDGDHRNWDHDSRESRRNQDNPGDNINHAGDDQQRAGDHYDHAGEHSGYDNTWDQQHAGDDHLA